MKYVGPLSGRYIQVRLCVCIYIYIIVTGFFCWEGSLFGFFF